MRAAVTFFLRGSWVTIEHIVAWAEAHLHTKWHLSPTCRLATMATGRKLEGCAPLGEGSWVPNSPSNRMSPGPRPTSVPSGILIHLAVWPQQTWAENWRCAPFWGGGAGSPSSTMWPGPRPTCIPRGILVYPTVWPQRTLAKNWGLCRFRGRELGPI